jgi:hypothetical protein
VESETLNRQLRIERWNQAALSASCVAVLGRDWAGTFAVWALRSLGVGHVLWIGEPREATEPTADRRSRDRRESDRPGIPLRSGVGGRIELGHE